RAEGLEEIADGHADETPVDDDLRGLFAVLEDGTRREAADQKHRCSADEMTHAHQGCIPEKLTGAMVARPPSCRAAGGSTNERRERPGSPRGDSRPSVRLVAVQQDRSDHARHNGDKHVVAPGLDPVVAPGWRAQVVTAPVIDDVLAAAIFVRQAPPAIEVVLGPGAALLVRRNGAAAVHGRLRVPGLLRASGLLLRAPVLLLRAPVLLLRAPVLLLRAPVL